MCFSRQQHYAVHLAPLDRTGVNDRGFGNEPLAFRKRAASVYELVSVDYIPT